MPCYEIRQTTVELKAANREALVTGLRAAGFKITESSYDETIWLWRDNYYLGDIANGTFQTALDSERAGIIANEIKRAYSTEIVKRQAARYGYRLQETRSQTRTEFRAQRRF